MDHLQTSEERKQLWYARHIQPRYIPVTDRSMNKIVGDIREETEQIKRFIENGHDSNDHVPSLSQRRRHHVPDYTTSTSTSNHNAGERSTSIPQEVPESIQAIPASSLLLSSSSNDDVQIQATAATSAKHHTPPNTTTSLGARQLVQHHLYKYGFVIISGTLSTFEINHALDLACDYLEAAGVTEEHIQQQERQKQQQQNINDNDNNNNNDTNDANINKMKEDDENNSTNTNNSVEGGILPFYGSGHSTFAWYLRTIPAVQSAFAAIWDCQVQELKTSLDGIILWKSRRRTPRDNNNDGDGDGDGDGDAISTLTSTSNISSSSTTHTTHRDTNHQQQQQQDDEDNNTTNFTNDWDKNDDVGWFHLDQNPRMKPNFESVQGLVNLLPCTTESGGNVVIMGSHLQFPEHYLSYENDTSNKEEEHHHQQSGYDSSSKCGGFTRNFYQKRLDEVDGDDWLEIHSQDVDILKPCNTISCLLRPGDVFIWDSRLVHCSYPGQKKKKKKQDLTTTTDKIQTGDEDILVTTAQLQNHGLIRAAGLVTMMPKCHYLLNDGSMVQSSRMDAVKASRTLTHWVNKVSPLGEENQVQVKKEKERVRIMHDMYKNGVTKKVLLTIDDLTEAQKELI